MNLASIWRPSATGVQFRPLESDITVDVAIIGGGITGLSLAHRLKQAGQTVAVLEMHQTGSGATSYSTGHLTAALDVDYPTIWDAFGQPGAAEAASKCRAAIDYIEAVVAGNRIACDFHRVDGWRFTEDAGAGEPLDVELRIARALGLDVALAEQGPLPFMQKSLRFRNQAMINPLRYANALALLLDGEGSHVFENTRVEEVTGGDPCVLKVGGFVVRARDVVHATHAPIGLVLPMQLRIAPYMSYVIAVQVSGALPPELYWDTATPYHYLRPARGPVGKSLLLVGGEDHKTGQDEDPLARFAALEVYARDRFDVAEVVARWSGEVFVSVDGLPYIGRLGGEKHIFGATGYGGTGLTFATVAAAEITDLIMGTEDSESVFRPQRYKPIASAPNFVRENANVAWHLIRDRLQRPEPVDGAVAADGEGRLIEVEGKKVAAIRTAAGQSYMLSPVCPHLGGIVRWNAAASTWDCPLHGSRFAADGTVVSGPACENLARMELPLPPAVPAATHDEAP